SRLFGFRPAPASPAPETLSMRSGRRAGHWQGAVMAPVPPVLSDADLIQGCIAGSNEAWRLLHQRYQAHVQAVARRALGPWGRCAVLVEEISNEVLEALWVGNCRRLRAYDARRADL